MISIESVTEDANARELLALIASMGMAGAPLVSYLGLFKPRLQPLRWSRALALANEVNTMTQNYAHLVNAAALTETVEALRNRRQQSDWKPLKNHNYFKEVLASVNARTVVTTSTHTIKKAESSKTAQGLTALQDRKK